MSTVTSRLQGLVDIAGQRPLTYAVLIIILMGMPFLTSPFIGAEIVVMAIFAMGYNIILGYGGELSFGHAAFFGLGAYATVLLLRHVLLNLYIAIVAAVILVTLVSVVFGYLSLRRRGIYFAMITLALAQMVYVIVFQWTGLTGGSNGISIPNISANIGPFVPMQNDIHFYVLVSVLFLLLFATIARVVNSPFGRVLKAIRESEERALHLGYDINSYLWLAFTMSGAVSAFAGALYAALLVFISPNILFWTISGEVVLMTIIGGVGTLTGPLVGATVFIFFRDTFTQITESWQLLFGAVIIAVVLLAPEGVVGLARETLLDEEDSFDVQQLLERLKR